MKYLKEQQKNPAGPRKTKPRSLPRASSALQFFEQFVMLRACISYLSIDMWSRVFFFFFAGVARDFLKVRNGCSHGIPEGLSVVKSGWRISMGVLCESLMDLQPRFPRVTCRLHHHRTGDM